MIAAALLRASLSRFEAPPSRLFRAVYFAAMLGALIPLVVASLAHANHGGIIARLNPLANVVPAPGAGGQGYRFNPVLAVFEPINKLGPLLAYAAPTVGKRNIFINSIYTHLDFDTLEDFSKLRRSGGSDKIPSFTIGQLDFIGQYGITDHWQVTAVLPFVFVNCGECLPGDRDINNDAGIGDLRFRTKYNFLESSVWIPDMSLLAEISVPSGNEDKFQGSGLVHITGMIIASKTYGDLITPHINFDFQVAAGKDDADDQNNVKWTIGSDFHPYSWINLSLDFMGRHKVSGLKDPELDAVIGENTYDVGLGIKGNPWKTLNLTFAAIIPLNPDIGLRTKATLRFGVEFIF